MTKQFETADAFPLGESEKSAALNRRGFLKTSLAGLALTALPFSPRAEAQAAFSSWKNPKYAATDTLRPTDEELITRYNNFYEFSLDKERVHKLVDRFETKPWKLEVGGLVEKPMTLDAGQLTEMFAIEQRVYRIRCVERWSGVIPWDGFTFRKLAERVSPKKEAKFVRFVSFYRPDQAQGQHSKHYPWPYTEGLRMDEAMHDLTMLAVGVYGKPLPKQNGAPVRLVVPWKYGFKSVKSITKIEFTEKMPKTLWNTLAPREYGFLANVNPEVDHPRWSQKYDKPLGEWFGSEKTRMFNGYSEVASLYRGMDLRRFF